jgi:hypothetical protein
VTTGAAGAQDVEYTVEHGALRPEPRAACPSRRWQLRRENGPFGVAQAGCLRQGFAHKLGTSDGRRHRISRVSVRHSLNARDACRSPNREADQPVMKRSFSSTLAN